MTVVLPLRIVFAPLRVAAGAARPPMTVASRWAGRGVLFVLDGVLASPLADDAVDRIVASRATERAIGQALGGDLVDVVGRDLVRFAVLERVTETVLAGDVLEQVPDRAEAAGVPERIAERLLADGIAEQVADRLLDGPELERIVDRALESPAMERLVTRVVESGLVNATITRLVDDTAVRLPERPALWTLVDELASSPMIADAVARQGAGFADEMAGEMRDRSRDADDWLERGARRLFRRRGARDEPPGSAPAPRAP